MEGKQQIFTVKIASEADKEGILELMKENSEILGYSYDNFKSSSEYILKDIHYGFFVYAETEDQKPAGLMLFTYEWSDWRNGLFFWMQTVHVKEELRHSGVFSEMNKFLQGYMKEKGSCGIRIYYEAKFKDLWEPIFSKLTLTESHYLVYHIDK